MEKYIVANAAFSKFSRNYMELKKNLPIRPSEMGVLNILAATPGPHSPVMLAGLLGVSKPMITANLTSLSAKGYITKEQSLEDKRVYHVLLTPQGRQLAETAKKDTNAQLLGLVEAMGEEKFDQLVRLTQEANQVLEAKCKEETEKSDGKRRRRLNKEKKECAENS